MINIFKYFIFNIFTIIICSLFNSLLYYFNIFNNSFYSVFKILIISISIFVFSFLYSNSSKCRKVISGIKFCLLFIIFSLIICLINSRFQFKIFIYYVIILFSSIIGSLVSNIKKSKN